MKYLFVLLTLFLFGFDHVKNIQDSFGFVKTYFAIQSDPNYQCIACLNYTKDLELLNILNREFKKTPYIKASAFVIKKTKDNIIMYLSSYKSIKLSMASMDKNETIKQKSLKNNNKINNQVLYKKITGFSSWCPGQLENEIKNGDWIPKKKENNIIFSNNPERSWEDIIKSIGIDTLEIVTQGAQA